MASSSSRTELIVVSAAAGALGGALVALALTAGRRSHLHHPHNNNNNNDNSHPEINTSKTLKRIISSYSGGVSTSSSASKQQGNGFSSSKAETDEFFSVDGFEDVKVDLMIEHQASNTPQVDKPDPYDPSKRKGYMSWDDYFMAIAFLSARRSKDPNRQVGACIVSQDRVILGIGYNGFPRGCSDDQLPWAKKSANGDPLQTKYPYVCHAEVNAILNKNHASASGQRLYVTLFPCNECAKIIIQAGIAEVVYFTDKGAHVENDAGSTEPAYVASRRLLSMAGIKVWQHQPADKMLVLEFR